MVSKTLAWRRGLVVVVGTLELLEAVAGPWLAELLTYRVNQSDACCARRVECAQLRFTHYQ